MCVALKVNFSFCVFVTTKRFEHFFLYVFSFVFKNDKNEIKKQVKCCLTFEGTKKDKKYLDVLLSRDIFVFHAKKKKKKKKKKLLRDDYAY